MDEDGRICIIGRSIIRTMSCFSTESGAVQFAMTGSCSAALLDASPAFTASPLGVRTGTGVVSKWRR